MWLFYAMTNGYIPAGNDGQMKVARNLSNKKLRAIAETFRAGRAGRVYLMRDWTQEMCELGPTAFCNYIARNGAVVAHS